STLSQSPMLGFHKQMDNRIKLLEEILSFRMQGVEFDNGDMYVDGHKAASDVRDEFVSVTEKLMDELAQCYNVLPQLDMNNTIAHHIVGDEKWFLENEKTVTQFCRKLAAERPLKDIRDEYNYPKKKGIKDECSRLLFFFYRYAHHRYLHSFPTRRSSDLEPPSHTSSQSEGLCRRPRSGLGNTAGSSRSSSARHRRHSNRCHRPFLFRHTSGCTSQSRRL